MDYLADTYMKEQYRYVFNSKTKWMTSTESDTRPLPLGRITQWFSPSVCLSVTFGRISTEQS